MIVLAAALAAVLVGAAIAAALDAMQARRVRRGHVDAAREAAAIVEAVARQRYADNVSHALMERLRERRAGL